LLDQVAEAKAERQYEKDPSFRAAKLLFERTDLPIEELARALQKTPEEFRRSMLQELFQKRKEIGSERDFHLGLDLAMRTSSRSFDPYALMLIKLAMKTVPLLLGYLNAPDELAEGSDSLKGGPARGGSLHRNALDFLLWLPPSQIERRPFPRCSSFFAEALLMPGQRDVCS